jgi:23S rRNA (cytidine2498-2'-O)-methyltransferase
MTSHTAATFVLATCQVGAEAALKAEFARRWSAYRFAYSRPGFLTFKAQPASPGGEQATLPDPVFARTCAWSLGKAQGASLPELVQRAWQAAGDAPYDVLHVYHRDAQRPGRFDFEPGPLADDRAIAQAMQAAGPAIAALEPAVPGQRVLDCVVVGPGEWWIGTHTAGPPHTCWPGGFCTIQPPVPPVSRAYFKMEEALRWSQLPVRAGQRVVEIGSAPGGAAQALLERGLLVTGIDPAEVHPSVLGHPHYEHIRKRGHDVRRREFRRFQWLTADLNVAPRYTLDTVEAIVTYPQVAIEGMLLMLKLLDWSLAVEIPDWVFRIRRWGYPHVRVRQLHHNRQEVCVAAWR